MQYNTMQNERKTRKQTRKKQEQEHKKITILFIIITRQDKDK